MITEPTELEHGHDDCAGIWIAPSNKQIICMDCGAVYPLTPETSMLAMRENQLGTVAIHLSADGKRFL